MYQALYRKWRPKVFSDVIGQPHITETLRRQAAEGRISHAYLFTGTRGTGKTTCAKILARAVNCEHPVDGDPCGVCAACTGIERGGSMDVLELDAASNSGVDQVRALRSEAVYSPAKVKKRVYIIDEVHMLSDAAFNALLKIMEEPPEHLMFILATTEVHKILPTILSRCQRFSFRRIPPKIIAQRLDYVAKQEGIDLRPDGSELLSRLADGALRDGLSLLDQCAAPGGAIDAAAVLDVLGLAGNLQTARIMESILKRDAQDALTQLDGLYNNGKDMGAVLSELSSLTRDLLLRKTAPEGGAELLSGGYDTALLDRLGQGVPGTRFLYFASTLQKAAAELYYSANRRLDTELCLLRLCDESLSGDLTALAARVRRLEDALTSGVLLPGSPRGVRRQEETKTESVPKQKPASGPSPEPAQEHRPEAKPEPAPERRPEAKPEPAPERRPEAKPEPAPERRPEAKPEPAPERRPEAKPEPAPERRPEAKPEPAPERRPEAKPEPAPERRPKAKSTPKPKAKPVPQPMPEEIDRPPWELMEPPPEKTMEQPPWELMEPPPEKTMEQPPWELMEPPPEETTEQPPRETIEPPDELPWEMKAPAPPKPESSAVPKPAVSGAAIPVPAEEPGSAQVVSGSWWPGAAEKCKSRVSPMYRAFLNCCAGVLEDSVVVIYAPDEITAGRLDNERIRTVLLEEAQEALGKTMISRLIFRVGNPPIGSPEENFKALLKNFGGQYDNVEFT